MFSRHKLPVVLQSEHSECALACLAMVAAYHGHPISMTQLRQRYPISQHGSTLRDLMTLAQWLGLSTRAVKVDIADIENLKFPAILHWDLDHFVVLKRARRSRFGRSRFEIHNPALGARQYRRADLSRHFTGIALELTPRPDFVAQAPPPGLKLTALLHGYRRLSLPLMQIIGLSIFIQAFALVAPFYLQFVVDEVLLVANTGYRFSRTRYVRVGSNCDLQHRLALRLECDGEPTFSPERRLSGGEQTYFRQVLKVRVVPKDDIQAFRFTLQVSSYRVPLVPHSG